jgi:hypothetical protein
MKPLCAVSSVFLAAVKTRARWFFYGTGTALSFPFGERGKGQRFGCHSMARVVHPFASGTLAEFHNPRLRRRQSRAFNPCRQRVRKTNEQSKHPTTRPQQE